MSTRDFDQYLGGTWTPAASGARRTVHSPYDWREVGSVAVSEVTDAERAIALAEGSFAETRRLPVHLRHDILRQIESAIGERREVLAQGITDEAGKPIREARAEVDRAR
ncbi:MAG: aldehyde dehydrogenase family protein, partial [Cytophagales bacterium]|nr:aldehyde dehydrogenase family protein [Armatimonadota bacterium]